MKKFTTKTDLRSRAAMSAYLAGHFRYNTMNSWNRSTSYANDLKIHTLGLPAEAMGQAWEMVACPEVRAAINHLQDGWAEGHGWQWQAAFNGRSGGYLVLYRGGIDHTAARTAQCDVCGKATWHKADTPCTADGCPGTLRVLGTPIPRIFTQPGKAVDQDGDFDGWDIGELRDRVKLVQSFDALCDAVVDCFTAFCRDYEVVEAEVPALRKIKTLQPVNQGDSL